MTDIEAKVKQMEAQARNMMDRTKPITGYEMYRWPEFKALCARLGIAWDLPTGDMVITIPQDGMVMVQHEYQARVPKDADKAAIVDTSNEHNETWRTKQMIRQEG